MREKRGNSSYSFSIGSKLLIISQLASTEISLITIYPMLFVGKTPIQTEILQDRKLLVLAPKKIIFSHLDFIEEYLSMPLIGCDPKRFYHQKSILQTLVVTRTTIEIFYCDWKMQIKLIRLIALHKEQVETVLFSPNNGWNVYGKMLQYEPVNVTFHSFRAKPTEPMLAECHYETGSYILTAKNLLKHEMEEPIREVNWRDRMMVLKNCDYNISMDCSRTQDGKRDVICINNQYALVISGYSVLYMINEPSIVYFSGQLLISSCHKGKMIVVRKFENKNATNMGIIYSHDGKLETAYLFEDELVILNYDRNQIHIHSMPLAQNNDTPKSNGRSHKRGVYQLKNSISQIIEQPEQASQYIQQQERQERERQEMQQLRLQVQKGESSPTSRASAVIRDIQVDGEQFGNDSLDGSQSEVLSRSQLQNRQRLEDQLLQHHHGKHIPIRNHNHNHTSHYKMKVTKSPSLDNQDSINQKSTDNSGSRNKNSYTIKPSKRNSDSHTKGSDHRLGSSNNGIEEVEESIISFEADGRQNSKRNEPQLLAKKVKYFLKGNNAPTKKQIAELKEKSFCQLIEEQLETYPSRLDELVQGLLLEMIEESEAGYFFQQYLQTHSPQFTKDKIKVVFGPLLQQPKYHPYILRSLQYFSISQVPSEILPFSPDFILLVKLISKDSLIQDLMNPSAQTIEIFLESYFRTSSFPQDSVIIQDEEIDITLPRNILNVLLYLNEQLQLELSIILKVYCAKLLQFNHAQVVEKLLEENVFQICQVPRKVLDEVVIQKFNQSIEQPSKSITQLWDVLPLLSSEFTKEYNVRLAVVTELKQNNIEFNPETLKDLKNQYNNLFTFLEDIIHENQCRDLVNLKFSSIYRSLAWVQQGEKLKRMPNEFVELIKILGEKLIQQQYIVEGFTHLETVCQKIRPSFLGKLILENLDGKFLNRLADIKEPIKSIRSIFPEYFLISGNSDVRIETLPRDTLIIPIYSQSFSCSWEKFQQLYRSNISIGSKELEFLTFCKLNISYQIYSLLQETHKKKFNKLLESLQPYIMVQLDDMNDLDDSINPKGLTNIKFEDISLSQPVHIQDTSMVEEDCLLDMKQMNNEEGRMRVYKSMTSLEEETDKIQVVRRAQSVKRKRNFLNSDGFFRLRLLEDNSEIIANLRQIYENETPASFLQAIKLLDINQIGLYHIAAFKEIHLKEIDIPTSQIFPFEVFLTKDPEQAYRKSVPLIQQCLSVKSFWAIYLLLEVLLGQGMALFRLFMEKIISQYRNDHLRGVVHLLLETLKPEVDSFLTKMKALSKKNKLKAIEQELHDYITHSIQ